MKLLVTGYARHGKDTVCGILHEEYGLRFISSSLFCAERAVRAYLAERGITYATAEECYADRVNHRAHWFDAISAYNSPDRARVTREMFVDHDIYCGLRNREEFDALKAENIIDASIWVDRSKHCPPEPETSMQLRPEDCEYVLDNNGDFAALGRRTTDLYRRIQADRGIAPELSASSFAWLVKNGLAGEPT